MSTDCAACDRVNAGTVELRNDTCFFTYDPEIGPHGCGVISPARHEGSLFELSPAEWEDTFGLLLEAKAYLDAGIAPDGYNVGWNEGPVAGQEIDHVRIFVMPRFRDEERAGRGIRSRLKQPANKRACGRVDDLTKDRLASNGTCSFEESGELILVGSGVIITHDKSRQAVFDLSPREWRDTFTLLQQVKQTLDERYRPDGYTIGWNCGRIGGQEVFHVHMHVIPRYADEPLAGKGLQHLVW